MFEHESHLVAAAIDSCNPLAEGSDQVLDGFEEHVGQDGALEMTPQPLDQIQARTVGRQPKDVDPVAVLFQPLCHGLRVGEPAVVADKANPAIGIGPKQSLQERQEVRSRLRRGHGVGNSPGGIVDSSVGDGFLILSGSGDFGLRADRRPDTAESRMAMDLDLILVDQDFRGFAASRFFFKR